MAAADFHLGIGDETSFAKTVGESDVYLFAGITGDLSANHVNEAVMAGTPYGRRIAHGALIVGYMSATSTRILDQARPVAPRETAVSLGYDGIRFLAPVFIGDTITIRYRVAAIDEERRRSTADITVTNQDGTLVAVARHIMKWVAG